jgi:HK97 family phage portal protein
MTESEYGVTVLVNASPLENPSISIRDPEVWYDVFGGGPTESGVRVTLSTALGYPPLWRAINLISGDVAKLPLNVYRRTPDGGKEPAKAHPGYNLLRRKASLTTNAFDVKRTLTAQALLRGNGYAAIDRNNRRDAAALYVLDASETFPAMVDGALWYVTQIGPEQIRLPARDVLHIKGLSPDGLVGFDVISLMAEALGVGMAAQRYGARFFGHGSNMSGLLMIPGHFQEEKIRNTMAAWNAMQSGLNNAHKVALLQDGVKFQQMTIAPEQAQFLQTRQYEVRATIANITGCPPHKLGDDSRTSHNSLEQENQSYLDDCLDTWLCAWEAECTDKLLSETQKAQDSHFVEFNRKALLRMSANDRANYYARLQEHGDLTINDVLRAENMPTIGAQGDRRYRPANLVEIGKESDMVDQPSAPTDTPQRDAAPADAILRAVIESNVTKSLTIEAERVVKAARTESNFVAWMDKFYPTWITHAELPLEGSLDAFTTHAVRSQQQLLKVAGSSTSANLPQAVADCVATWHDRGELITETLTKQLTGG